MADQVYANIIHEINGLLNNEDSDFCVRCQDYGHPCSELCQCFYCYICYVCKTNNKTCIASNCIHDVEIVYGKQRKSKHSIDQG